MAKVRTPVHQSKVNHYSPRNDDSPSRQLQFELERAFSQIHLHETERQKLHAFNRRSVQEGLDAKELAQAIAHQSEIEDAVAKHEIVRQQAVAVLEAHIKEEEEKRRRQEEEERHQREAEARRRAEEQRKAKEEIERKAREEREKVEAAKRAAYEKAKAEAEEKKRQDREDTVQREQAAREKAQAQAQAQAEASRKKDEENQAAATKAQEAARSKEAAERTTQPTSSNNEERHKQYLRIHQDLKGFRKDFWVTAKKDPALKGVIGDMRRELRTSVGQLRLTDKKEKGGNQIPVQRIKNVLMRALKDLPSPPVVLNRYLPSHLNLLDKNSTTIPSLLLYLLSVLSKAVVNAFVGECAVNTKAAEPIGTMVAQVFSMTELQFQRNAPSSNSGLRYEESGGNAPTPPMKPSSVSLITILMCKFHATAPILFGISASENTPAGKLRLGWRREHVSDSDKKAFVLEQQQYDRLIGLGAGYASIALRNFSKSPFNNPFPPVHFWESFAHIVNTPSKEIQTSHLLLLKSMLENSTDRFVLFFGAAAVAALREGLVEWPRTFPVELAQKPVAKSLGLLADSLKKDKNFSLT